MCDPYIDIELAREYIADALEMTRDMIEFIYNDEFIDANDLRKLLKLSLEILDGNTSNVYSE